MKLTTLDVLIITALSQQTEPLVLPYTTFDTYSNFVKHSPIFSIQPHNKQDVSIRIDDYRAFGKKLSYWRSMYVKDRLVPFEENGFSAVRLLENIRLFSKLSDMRSGWWNLETDKYYFADKEQPRSGLCWAWDWFFVILLVTHTHHDVQNLSINLTLESPQQLITLFFPSLSRVTSAIHELEQSLCVMLHTRTAYPYTYNELMVTPKSAKATFAGKIIDLMRTKSKTRKMLLLVAQNQGNCVPLGEAFRAVYGKKNTYNPHTSETHPLGTIEEVKLTPSKKVKLLKDTAAYAKNMLDKIITKKHLPYSIKIHAGEDGFQFEILPKK